MVARSVVDVDLEVPMLHTGVKRYGEPEVELNFFSYR